MKVLHEAEDVDDSMALKHMAKECEEIKNEFQMDFKTDLISSIPSLVTYCIQHLLKYQTPSLISRVEDMKIRIQAEEFNPEERNDDEYSNEDEDEDIDKSDQEEFSSEEGEEEKEGN